jgi:hypothetical protein
MLGVRVEDVNGICQKKGKAAYRLPHGSCFEGPEALGTAIPAVALALGAFSDCNSDYPGGTPARNIRVFNCLDPPSLYTSCIPQVPWNRYTRLFTPRYILPAFTW